VSSNTVAELVPLFCAEKEKLSEIFKKGGEHFMRCGAILTALAKQAEAEGIPWRDVLAQCGIGKSTAYAMQDAHRRRAEIERAGGDPTKMSKVVLRQELKKLKDAAKATAEPETEEDGADVRSRQQRQREKDGANAGNGTPPPNPEPAPGAEPTPPPGPTTPPPAGKPGPVKVRHGKRKPTPPLTQDQRAEAFAPLGLSVDDAVLREFAATKPAELGSERDAYRQRYEDAKKHFADYVDVLLAEIERGATPPKPTDRAAASAEARKSANAATETTDTETTDIGDADQIAAERERIERLVERSTTNAKGKHVEGKGGGGTDSEMMLARFSNYPVGTVADKIRKRREAENKKEST